MSTTMKSLLIENYVYPHHMDVIANYFEKYQIAKVESIEYCETNMSAILKLEYWYDNVCAANLFERINEMGEAKIVYDDPEYFTVKFIEEVDEQVHEEDTTDSREEYIARENHIVNSDGEPDDKPDNDYGNYEGEYDANCDGNGKDEDRYGDDNYYSQDYLEDDVIENSNNISNLFTIVNELKETIVFQEKLLKTFNRRLLNISKKTNVLYKTRPMIIKRSVWEGRLRYR